MNREDVIRIALEVGFFDGEIDKCQLMLERFAYLIAEQEREACAKVCEAWQEWGADGALLAKAIRARGQA
jgi:hypothetical protein